MPGADVQTIDKILQSPNGGMILFIITIVLVARWFKFHLVEIKTRNDAREAEIKKMNDKREQYLLNHIEENKMEYAEEKDMLHKIIDRQVSAIEKNSEALEEITSTQKLMQTGLMNLEARFDSIEERFDYHERVRNGNTIKVKEEDFTGRR